MDAAFRRPALATLVVFLAAVFACAVATATEPSTEPLAREVGPHRFPGTSGIPNPFLSTFVRSSTGIAMTSGMEATVYDFQDPPQLVASKQIDLMYLVQEFEFQQRVGQDVAVKAALSGSGRLGTDTAALLTEGISVITGWTAGGIVRLAERPGFKLSGSLEGTGNSLTAISIRNWAEDVMAAGGLSDTTISLAQNESNLRVNAGLRAAWGKSLATGYLLYGDIGFQEPYDNSDDTEVYWKAGGAVNLDMRERWTPDLDFLLSAVYQSESSRNSDLGGGGWQTGVGVFYSGRRDLTAGLQMMYTQLKQTDVDNTFGAYAFNLVLRYDFR